MVQRALKFYFQVFFVSVCVAFGLTGQLNASEQDLVAKKSCNTPSTYFRDCVQTYSKGILRWEESSLFFPELTNKKISENIFRASKEVASWSFKKGLHSRDYQEHACNLRPLFMRVLLNVESTVADCKTVEEKEAILDDAALIAGYCQNAFDSTVILPVTTDEDRSVNLTMFAVVDRFLNEHELTIDSEKKGQLVCAAHDRLEGEIKKCKDKKQLCPLFFKKNEVLSLGLATRGLMLLSQIVEFYPFINTQAGASEKEKNELLKYVLKDYNKRLDENAQRSPEKPECIWAELFDPYAIKSSCDQYYETPHLMTEWSSSEEGHHSTSVSSTSSSPILLKEKNKPTVNPRVKRGNPRLKKKKSSSSLTDSVRNIPSPRSVSEIALRIKPSKKAPIKRLEFDVGCSLTSPEDFLESVLQKMEEGDYLLLTALFEKNNADARGGIDSIVQDLLNGNICQNEILERLDQEQDHLVNQLGYCLFEADESESESEWI